MSDSQSTVSMWVCLLLAVALLALRLLMRRIRGHSFTRGDGWCFLAAIFILARLLLNYYLLQYGSTRILTDSQRLALLEPENSHRYWEVVTGSKIIVATRTLIIFVLWSLKMAVLDLLAKLIMKMPYERKVLYFFWTVMGATFIASLVSVFIGCTPFHLHWQIYPNPGDCVIGDPWLFTYEISNIITDLLLMALPFSLIMSVTIEFWKRLRILFLFSIGVFLVAVSIIRITIGKGSRQQRAHTLWASLEILCAVIVAVTPTLYALLRNRHEDSSYGRSQFDLHTTTSRTHRGSAATNERFHERDWRTIDDQFGNLTKVELGSVEDVYKRPGAT